MANINYEALQSTMSDQNRRFTYARNQLDSPYLRKRMQEVENYRLKKHRMDSKKRVKPDQDTTNTSGKPVSTKSGGNPKGKGSIGSSKPSGDSVDLSRFDRETPSSSSSTKLPSMKRMGPSGNPFQGTPPSPTNFRDQKTAGARAFSKEASKNPLRSGRSPFAEPGQATNYKVPRTTWRDRNKGLVAEGRAEAASRRFLRASSTEALSSARGVTHSTGESWAGRTGRKLTAKADAIKQKQNVRKRRETAMAERRALGEKRRTTAETSVRPLTNPAAGKPSNTSFSGRTSSGIGFAKPGSFKPSGKGFGS